jgi:hypothetical protein
MIMDFGMGRRVVVEATGSEAAAVYAGACRLMGLFCATVGKTGLPVDPDPPVEGGGGEGEPLAPVIAAVTPNSGPDGTEVVISGENFGEQGENSSVSFGPSNGSEVQPILNWTDTEITISATQGGLTAGFPVPVMVTNDAGLVNEGSPLPDFTFTASRDASKSSERKEDKKHSRKKGSKEQDEPERERVSAKQHAMPDFPSGGGIMLTNHDGSKILVGPFELEAGKLYPLPLEFPDGIAVVNSGALDVTLIFASA